MVLKNIEIWLLLLCSRYLFAQDKIVQIPDGLIRGRTQRTIEGTTFYQFLGIPFGQPPINQLRFQVTDHIYSLLRRYLEHLTPTKLASSPNDASLIGETYDAPRAALPWFDILDATYEKSPCFQISYNITTESEDCLFINVHTPRDPLTNPNLSVMVWIYGGGFIDGWSELAFLGPQHFMDHGVVLVTFNYRVGPFGFFSTSDNAIPGNAGLKDQNLALQWVQKNIRFFGGDPEKVTIFGQSAGAASVIYHILSPKSAELFRAAIAESASAITPFAYQRDEKAITYETAGYIDPKVADLDTYGLLDFLQKVPAQQIKDAAITKKNTENIEYQLIKDGSFYAPVVEHEHEDAFISKMMYEILESGDINKVPLIIGMNSGEAVFYADDPAGLNYMALVYDQNHTLLIPRDMHVHDDETRRNAEEAIKNIYAPDTSCQENPSLLVSYMNDQCFMRSIIKHAELQSALTDVYFYQFSYTGVLGRNSDVSLEGFSDRVRHAEDLDYLFAHNYTGLNSTDLSKYPASDAVVSNRFITLFTNFAKTLNPTPEPDELLENIIWPKVTADDFQYLDIGSYSQIRSNPRQGTYEKWDPIYAEFGERPFDTY